MFRRARAALVYDGDVRDLLLALKFGGRERVAHHLGRIACREWLGPGKLEGYAAVVPVPLSRRRRRQRGFNQAERIGRAVATLARTPLHSRILFKVKDRPPQAGLSATSRRRNVAGAYQASLPPSLRGEDLLLVDDVLTTGATADAASRALLRSGAHAVDVLTIARVP